MPHGGRIYRKINRVPFEFYFGSFRLGMPTFVAAVSLGLLSFGLISISITLAAIVAVVSMVTVYIIIRVINALDDDGAMSETTVVRTAVKSWINRDNRA